MKLAKCVKCKKETPYRVYNIEAQEQQVTFIKKVAYCEECGTVVFARDIAAENFDSMAKAVRSHFAKRGALNVK